MKLNNTQMQKILNYSDDYLDDEDYVKVIPNRKKNKFEDSDESYTSKKQKKKDYRKEREAKRNYESDND